MRLFDDTVNIVKIWYMAIVNEYAWS